MFQAAAVTRHARTNGPLLMSLGVAVGAIGGSLIGGAFGASSAALGRKFAREEAAKQRDWQQEMYSRRYRRTMADMKAAGLNPILAYKQGTGGGVPSGAYAQAQQGQEGQTAARGASAGIEAAIGLATANKLKQDTLTSAAQERNTDKKTSQLGQNEPMALIMEAIAEVGVKPVIQWIKEQMGTAKKESEGSPIGDNFPNFIEKFLPEFPRNLYRKYDIPQKRKK